MKRLVFNSTPLIYLSKIGLSEVIRDLEEEKLTSMLVKEEVVDRGQQKGLPDANIVRDLFNKEVFKICQPTDTEFLTRILKTHGLHPADADVLALAKENQATALIDDAIARKTAKIYGVDYAGTPFILARAYHEKIVSKETAKKAINDMVTVGWRCSIETYAKIIQLIDGLE